MRAFLVLSLALTFVAPGLAWATDDVPADAEVEEEPIPEIPVVEAETDPVRRLVGQAANPVMPEEQAQARFDELVAMGGVALPSLALIYRGSESTELEIWVSARALGRIGGEGARTTLMSGLDSPRIITRMAAVSGLELMKDKESVESLEKALFDKALAVRAGAADALAAIGSRRSSEALSEALNIPANFRDGRSLFVRRHIIDALGEIGSIGGIDALVGVLDGQEEPAMQLAAVHSLQKITGMSFRPAGSGPDAPVSAAEVQGWKNWWSNRSVGQTAE